MTVEASGLPLAAAFERASDDDIESYVERLPVDRVVEALYLVTELRRALSRGEKMLMSRVVGEQLMAVGETWTAPDGSEHFWGGDRERVCSDPATLKEQLSELPLTPIGKLALRAAFKDQPMKVYLTEIDKIERFGGPEAKSIIRNFIDWKESSPKLRPRDEKR